MARFAESSGDLEQGVVIGDGEETATWRVSTTGEDEEDDEGARTVDFTLAAFFNGFFAVFSVFDHPLLLIDGLFDLLGVGLRTQRRCD